VLAREGQDGVGVGHRSRACRDEGSAGRWAMSRALTLSPSASIADGGGPIQVRPASRTAWAKPAFSARKP
jgi:hypothetical protein